jgi:hypothetical protein
MVDAIKRYAREVADLKVGSEQFPMSPHRIQIFLVIVMYRECAAHFIKDVCMHVIIQVKLAEKDAQLMGGFGDMSRLKDLDDDLGIPMIMMPPSQVMCWVSP